MFNHSAQNYKLAKQSSFLTRLKEDIWNFKLYITFSYLDMRPEFWIPIPIFTKQMTKYSWQ